MPIRLADLILRVPADVERRVRETSTRHGPALREAIRSECGFLLQAKRDTDSRRIGAQVPVTVKAGLPASLEDVGFTDDFERCWGVIGLVSDWVGSSVEDLTIVVLTHELAHAYTQLGADIDGRRWPAAAFRRADLPLTEGLAQYYTQAVLERLKDRFDGA